MTAIRIRTCTRTVTCKVEVDPTTDVLLHQTMAAFNAAASFCARVAWEQNIYDSIVLHKKTYKQTRNRFRLSAQLTAAARNKALAAVRGARKRKGSLPVFKPAGGLKYDSRSYTIRNQTEVSLSTMTGRRWCRLILGVFQRQRLADSSWQMGSAVLICRKRTWYLLITQTCAQPDKRLARGKRLEVALDTEHIATTPKGAVLDPAIIRPRRRRTAEHKQRLRQRNTRSSRRRLRQVRSREVRFQRDVNHRISKLLIQQAIEARKALVVPRPSSVALRAPAEQNQPRMAQDWDFFQLVRFIFYKARLQGVHTSLPTEEDADPEESSAHGRSQPADRAALQPRLKRSEHKSLRRSDR